MARGLCAYTVLDATSVPERKRRGFVAITASRWVPFPDFELHAEWAGDRAMLWAWPRSVRDAGPDGELVVNPRRILPESLFRGVPLAEGEVLVAMDRGIEGRIWRGFVLLASEWWESPPSLEEWNWFRRGAGLAPAGQLPLVEAWAIAEHPWSGKRSRAVSDMAVQYRKHLVAVVVGLLAAALFVPLGATAKLWLATRQVEQEIADQGGNLGRILDAREAAGRDLDTINSLLGLRPPAPQLRLMAAVAQLIPSGSGQVLEWRMSDASNLEVDVKMAQPDPAALARAWEASELFDAVNVELGRNQDEVRIKARIVRPAPGRTTR
ncbi:MAG: hypothetical protein V4704_00785 [Pseudomonadota bacterium]